MSAPQPPEVAAGVFGAALPLVQRYAELLCSTGVERGLLGPSEPSRIWQRHLLNSAAVAGQLPYGARCLDLGSGAGLPGVVLALLRPDLEWLLLDATRRRTEFLQEIVGELAVGDRVAVRWGRAEELAGTVGVDVVVARAVAPLPKLWSWAGPLLTAGGRLVAVKGERAELELADFRRSGVGAGPVTLVSGQAGGETARMVVVEAPEAPAASPAGPVRRSASRSAGGAPRRTARFGTRRPPTGAVHVSRETPPDRESPGRPGPAVQ